MSSTFAVVACCFLVSGAQAAQIYATDFEAGNLSGSQYNAFSWASPHNTEVSTDQASSGSHSLKFTFAGGPDGTDAFAEQRFALGGHYPDLWIRYDLYIPSNYFHRDSTGSDNNKGLMKLWAQDYSAASREGPLLGPSFWPRSGGTSKSIVFASARVNGVETIGNHFWSGPDGPHYDPGDKNEAITSNDLGHWMTIVIHAKYASIANDDGVFETWKTDWQGNTVKLHDIQNGAWYGTMPSSPEPARGFANGYLLGWANSGFDEDTFFYIDNIEFSTTPLPIGDGPTVANPNPPMLSVTQ